MALKISRPAPVSSAPASSAPTSSATAQPAKTTPAPRPASGKAPVGKAPAGAAPAKPAPAKPAPARRRSRSFGDTSQAAPPPPASSSSAPPAYGAGRGAQGFQEAAPSPGPSARRTRPVPPQEPVKQEFSSELLSPEDLAVVVDGQRVEVSDPYFAHFSREARDTIWGNRGPRNWMRKVAHSELTGRGYQVALDDIIIPVPPMVNGAFIELPRLKSPQPAEEEPEAPRPLL